MDDEAQASEARFVEYIERFMGASARLRGAGGTSEGLLHGIADAGRTQKRGADRFGGNGSVARLGGTSVAAAFRRAVGLVGRESLLAKVRELVVPAMETAGPDRRAWIVDDTGFVKKGVHSVGVARQYCGRLGKTDNWHQVAVTLSIAQSHQASLPIAYRLYLPEEWANDAARRSKAHVPDDVKFRTKPEIALRQIRAALMAGVARGVVLTDAAYGSDGGFRAGVTEMGLIYAVAVQSTISVWPPGMEPLPPKPWSGRGRKPSRTRRDADHRPVSAKALATTLPKEAWRDVSWREGSNQTLTSRFAAVRIRPATRDGKLTAPQPLEWLLIEWPEDEREPTKYWLSTLPEDTPIEVLVDTAKLRWRIERDYEELKERTRPRPFRRTRLARIPSPRHALHRRLWIPDPRESGLSPLRTPAPRRPCPSPSSKTPRRPRSDPSATRLKTRCATLQKATDRRPRPVALPMPVLPIVHAETTALSALMTQ